MGRVLCSSTFKCLHPWCFPLPRLPLWTPQFFLLAHFTSLVTTVFISPECALPSLLLLPQFSLHHPVPGVYLLQLSYVRCWPPTVPRVSSWNNAFSKAGTWLFQLLRCLKVPLQGHSWSSSDAILFHIVFHTFCYCHSHFFTFPPSMTPPSSDLEGFWKQKPPH